MFPGMQNIPNYMYIIKLETLLSSPCFKGTLSKNLHKLPHSPLMSEFRPFWIPTDTSNSRVVESTLLRLDQDIDH